MGGMKRMMEVAAERMETDDVNAPEVLAEVARLISLEERRLIVLETHPNSGGCWCGMLGTETEVLQYLQKMADKGFLDYVGGILELKPTAEEETLHWIEFEEYQPIGVRVRPPSEMTGPTPPLPGLEKRLAGIEASAFGVKKSVWSILSGMYDKELEELFTDALEGMLQAGRLLPPWEKDGQKDGVSCQR